MKEIKLNLSVQNQNDGNSISIDKEKSNISPKIEECKHTNVKEEPQIKNEDKNLDFHKNKIKI